MSPAGGLVPDGPLGCAAGLRVSVRSDGQCEVDAPGGRVRLGPHALSLLGAFAVPHTVVEAIALLECQLSGKRDAIDMLATIAELCRIRALQSADDRAEFAVDVRSEGFGAAPIHAAMLEDRVRTGEWLAAVGELVRPGDVVLDIGTGTGVLAVQAALAGARHVYAIEASGCAEAARALAASNRVSDRVTVIRGWSTSIELPERAHLLVSEILDDDPFQERVLESIADAFERLVEPDARVLPRRVSLFVVPVEIAENEYGSPVFNHAAVQRWSQRYAMDFSSLLDEFGPGSSVGVRRRHAARWRQLSAPVRIVDVELGGVTSPRIEASVDVRVAEGGTCHGAYMYFDVELAPGRVVTTSPRSESGASHWLNPTLFLSRPRAVEPGESISFRYRYPGAPSLELML